MSFCLKLVWCLKEEVFCRNVFPWSMHHPMHPQLTLKKSNRWQSRDRDSWREKMRMKDEKRSSMTELLFIPRETQTGRSEDWDPEVTEKERSPDRDYHCTTWGITFDTRLKRQRKVLLFRLKPQSLVTTKESSLSLEKLIQLRCLLFCHFIQQRIILLTTIIISNTQS